uniref:protein-histidine N-methyltransferase n=1 Tax=Latimeria chalumnae TaxID=7897 RepID=H3A3Z2_LATCH|nr:PREDICTED: histidine protein methyltransferase 1 homolog [Latimeria chalumnae]|eukprot:XP_006011932.1 PREDICTED: histidine protein methyltransferase 1 homolog [Latimeria chalumnae]
MAFQFNFEVGDRRDWEEEEERGTDEAAGSSGRLRRPAQGYGRPLPEEEVLLTGHKGEGNPNGAEVGAVSGPATEEPGKAEEKPAAAEEHRVTGDLRRALENRVVERLWGKALPPLKHVNQAVVERSICAGAEGSRLVSAAVAARCDLLSGAYEGGLKIWECTFDLLTYLQAAGVELAEKRVLDLGCGAGLLGILALKKNAKVVHFQDYNRTVIEAITIPNVLINCEEEEDEENEDCIEPCHKKRKESEVKEQCLQHRCRFFSGEWSNFLQLLLNGDDPPKYDIILTSETIYNTVYYSSLHDVLCNLLDEKGRVYLASKIHYFGVGGGVQLFETFVDQRNVFSTKTAKVTDQGLKRFIIEMTFKNE